MVAKCVRNQATQPGHAARPCFAPDTNSAKAFVRRVWLRMLRLPVVLAAHVALAHAKGDYPTAPSPTHPEAHLRIGPAKGEECAECPWLRPEMGKYPLPFNARNSAFKPIHRGKYFDMYGHWIETRYSEVFWTAQPAVPLPPNIVQEFKGRVISFTGFEVDVVAGGENNETEWSVPEFEVYNHHYCATITGSAAKMTYVGSRAQVMPECSCAIKCIYGMLA